MGVSSPARSSDSAIGFASSRGIEERPISDYKSHLRRALTDGSDWEDCVGGPGEHEDSHPGVHRVPQRTAGVLTPQDLPALSPVALEAGLPHSTRARGSWDEEAT